MAREKSARDMIDTNKYIVIDNTSLRSGRSAPRGRGGERFATVTAGEHYGSNEN